MKLFKLKHLDNLGVPLLEDVHFDFHNVYGDDTTLEQLLDYKNNYIAKKAMV